MLPQISGVDVCRQIRTRSRVPIIMVTARERGDRRRRRPRGRRRRLRHEAVPAPRAHRPGARRAAPRPDRRRDERRLGRRDRDRRRAPRRRPPRGLGARRPGRAAAQGVRAARAAAGERGPGAHPRRAHRPHLGPELLRRHQDARRAREAAAGEGRGGPGQPDPHRHRARRRLPLREARAPSPAERERPPTGDRAAGTWTAAGRRRPCRGRRGARPSTFASVGASAAAWRMFTSARPVRRPGTGSRGRIGERRASTACVHRRGRVVRVLDGRRRGR